MGDHDQCLCELRQHATEIQTLNNIKFLAIRIFMTVKTFGMFAGSMATRTTSGTTRVYTIYYYRACSFGIRGSWLRVSRACRMLGLRVYVSRIGC